MGERKFKADLQSNLIYAHASCEETITHLEMIAHIHTSDVTSLLSEYNILGSKINTYIRYVGKNWNSFPIDDSQTQKSKT